MLGKENKSDDTQNLGNAIEDNIPPVHHPARKRKTCGQMSLSHSQPTANTDAATNWFQQCKYQKAVVKKHTKSIERHLNKIERENKKLEKISKQSKLFMDIVNRTF